MIYEFDEFRIDAGRRLLFRSHDQQIAVAPKVFDTLLYLVGKKGEVIDKDELISAIWTDTIVEENNLNKNISTLRRILGEDPGEHRFIVTVPGRGYKFVADVRSTEKYNKAPALVDPVNERKPNPPSRFVLVAAVSLIVVAAMLAGWTFWSARNAPADRTATQTLAILPFRPLVAENRDEALELGMADTLISRMGSNSNVIIRPLSAVRNFGGLEQDAVAAGNVLGVESVLEGNIQRSAERIRVNVRLVKVADGSLLWAGTFDERYTDIFIVQDVISSRVASALSLQLSGDGKARLTKRYTENPEAYQAFARGRYHLEKYTAIDSRRAIEYFQHAIAIDGNFAAAYAHLSAIYTGLAGAKDFPRRETVLLARQNALKAISLDDRLPTGHEVYGTVLFRYDYDPSGAEQELRRAIDLDPNDASAHETYGGLLIALGRFDEASAEMRRAAEIDPLSASICASIGNALLFARHYEDAITQYRKALELDAYFHGTHNGLAIAHQMQGHYSESVEERARIVEIAGDQKGAAFMRQSFAQQGWTGFLRNITESGEAPATPSYVKASCFAELGEKDKAFEILNDLYVEGASVIVMLKVDPRFDSLRDDARFGEILNRMGL